MVPPTRKTRVTDECRIIQCFQEGLQVGAVGRRDGDGFLVVVEHSVYC